MASGSRPDAAQEISEDDDATVDLVSQPSEADTLYDEALGDAVEVAAASELEGEVTRFDREVFGEDVDVFGGEDDEAPSEHPPPFDLAADLKLQAGLLESDEVPAPVDGGCAAVISQIHLCWIDIPLAVREVLSENHLDPTAYLTVGNVIECKEDLPEFMSQLSASIPNLDITEATAPVYTYVKMCQLLRKMPGKETIKVPPAVERSLQLVEHGKRARLAEASSSAGPSVAQLTVLNRNRRRRPRTKRAAAMAREDTADGRKRVEEAERDRWVTLLITLLLAAGFPAIKDLLQQPKGEELLRHAAGRSRAKTIRQYVRYWIKLSRWLAISYVGVTMPLAHHIMFYLAALFEAGCARTVPRLVIASVRFIEEKGGVPPHARTSASPLLLQMAEDLTMRLSAGAPPTKKAPMLSLMVICSLEVLVCDLSAPVYWRFFSFAMLLGVWASMRMDDLQGLLPSTFVMLSRGLEALVTRTKVSGPGRRVRWLTVFISADAWIIKPWLRAGYDVATNICWAERDYLIPAPNREYDGFDSRPASAVELSALFFRVLGMLAPVRWNSLFGCFQGSGPPLLTDETLRFWSGHSLRNWLASASAVLGAAPDPRDFCGRWAADASDEYTRTAREYVHQLHELVATRLKRGDRRYTEELLNLQIRTHLTNLRVSESAIDLQLERLDVWLVIPNSHAEVPPESAADRVSGEVNSPPHLSPSNPKILGPRL